MSDFYTVLTDTGRSKLAQAAANNTTLSIVEMALGDGGGQPVPAPTGTEAALVNEVYRATLNALTVAGAQFTAELVVPNTSGGWSVRELGLFDTDGDLVAYANTPEIYKASTLEGVPMDFRPTLTVNIDAPNSVQVIVNPAIVSASKQWVDDGYLAKARNLTDLDDINVARTTLGAGAAGGLATLDASKKVPLAQLPAGQANGVASLDSAGKLPSNQLPAIAIADTFTANTEAAMLALPADQGDMCVRTDLGATYVLSSAPASTLANWIKLQVPASVSSVAGKTGTVVLAAADVGLGSVDNTADVDKPVSTVQAQADATTLASAKSYTDSGDTTTLASAKSYADSGDTAALASAKSYADSGDTAALASAKSYADSGDTAQQQALATHKSDTGAHGATSAATPNRIARRDASGRLQVANPSSAYHAANMGWVLTTISSSSKSSIKKIDDEQDLDLLFHLDPDYLAGVKRYLAWDTPKDAVRQHYPAITGGFIVEENLINDWPRAFRLQSFWTNDNSMWARTYYSYVNEWAVTKYRWTPWKKVY